jgi:hypothetical protein
MNNFSIISKMEEAIDAPNAFEIEEIRKLERRRFLCCMCRPAKLSMCDSSLYFAMKIITAIDYVIAALPVTWLAWGILDTLVFSAGFYSVNFTTVNRHFIAPMILFQVYGIFLFFFTALGTISLFYAKLVSLFKFYLVWKIFEIPISITLLLLVAKAFGDLQDIDLMNMSETEKEEFSGIFILTAASILFVLVFRIYCIFLIWSTVVRLDANQEEIVVYGQMGEAYRIHVNESESFSISMDESNAKILRQEAGVKIKS